MLHRIWKALLLACLLPLSTYLAADEPPLRLAYARYEAHYGRLPGHSLTGVIKVRKDTNTKKVWVRYSQDGKVWKDQAAGLQGVARDGSELWSFVTPLATLDSPRRYQFALRVEKDQQVLWDNNAGRDYRVDASTWPVPIDTVAVLAEEPIALHHAFRYDAEKSLVGSIDLRNIAYKKDVRVRYSLDKGESYRDVSARYAFALPDRQTERWEFKIPLEPEQDVQFLVLMNVDGATYTDDNFGLLFDSSGPGFAGLFY